MSVTFIRVVLTMHHILDVILEEIYISTFCSRPADQAVCERMNGVRCVDVVQNRIHVDTFFFFSLFFQATQRIVGLQKLTNTSSMKQWGSHDAADVAVWRGVNSQ